MPAAFYVSYYTHLFPQILIRELWYLYTRYSYMARTHMQLGRNVLKNDANVIRKADEMPLLR